MKENKEETQLRSAEEILHRYESHVKHADVPIYLQENVLKAMEEYAQQFKEQLAIEIKVRDGLKEMYDFTLKENNQLRNNLCIERHLVKIKNTQLELKQKEIDRLKDDLFTVADPDHPEYKSIKERYNT